MIQLSFRRLSLIIFYLIPKPSPSVPFHLSFFSPLNPPCVLGASNVVLLSFPLSCVWSSNGKHQHWSIVHVFPPKPGKSLVTCGKQVIIFPSVRLIWDLSWDVELGKLIWWCSDLLWVSEVFSLLRFCFSTAQINAKYNLDYTYTL